MITTEQGLIFFILIHKNIIYTKHSSTLGTNISKFSSLATAIYAETYSGKIIKQW